MRILLDSHTLIWAVDDQSKISQAAMAAMRNAGNELLISIASIWEMSIKAAKGNLPLSMPYRQWMDRAIVDLDLEILPITLDHADRQAILPFDHRDPFDRMLASQSLVEETPLVSADKIFDAYGVNRLWD